MISRYKDTIRRATIHDAMACASIVDEWVEKTAEMPHLTNFIKEKVLKPLIEKIMDQMVFRN